MFREAFAAGVWASLGSTLGKLSGTTEYVGNNYILWLLFLGLMVVVNTWSCRYFLHSLDAADNTVTPTVVSSASNYICSGILGLLVFGEAASIRWWLGATLITVGLSLVSKDEKGTKNDNEKEHKE